MTVSFVFTQEDYKYVLTTIREGLRLEDRLSAIVIVQLCNSFWYKVRERRPLLNDSCWGLFGFLFTTCKQLGSVYYLLVYQLLFHWIQSCYVVVQSVHNQVRFHFLSDTVPEVYSKI